ncbi:MAG: M1 family metallopeptidase [Chloroflexi bacterium]|nr:M1 family metallopeptidase [Chloroflexota bacterium]
MSSRLVAVILLVLTVLPTPAHADSLAPPPPSESRTKYDIVVNLDYQNASLSARETVVYTNSTTVDLSSVVFNVTPAEFNAFTLNGATAGGRKVDPLRQGVVMEVPLPELLPRGKAVTVVLDFRLNVPRRGGRFGVGDGLIALGNWFPVVGVYNDSRLLSDGRPAGWSKHGYVEVGDAFFTETADYEVTVNTSSPVTIAHTGHLIAKEANRWQIQARGVRDFALAISSRYQTQSRSVDGVVVTAYYLPEHAAAGERYLEAAAQAILRLNRLLVPYPFPTLHLAEVYSQSSIAQGQEYPNLLFLSSTLNDLGGGIDSYLAYVVMHEVTHQWFYGLVGNDQVYQPWLDEAFATWFPYEILRLNAPELRPGVWQSRVIDLVADSVRRDGDSPIDKSIYDFADELHYYNIVYRKGALFLEDVYKAMGETAFLRALQSYVKVFQDRIATPIALLDILQSHTSVNLSPIIARYFTYGRYKGGEPVVVSVEFPEGSSWSGTVRPVVKSSQPISELAVYVEDQVVWAGRSEGNSGVDPASLSLDTKTLKDGEEYLLTVKVTSAKKTFERAARFGVRNTAAKAATGTKPPLGASPVPDSAASSARTTGESSGGRWVWIIVPAGLLLAVSLVYAVRRAG